MPGFAFSADAYPTPNQYDVTGALGANHTTMVRVLIPCAWTANRMAFNITAAGTSTCKMSVGLYADSGGNPTIPVFWSGVLDAASTTIKV
jgi:hypothetical protein